MWDYEASEKAAKHRAVRAERMAEAKKKGTHTKLEWLALQYITGHQCAKCGSEYYVKDHIVPLCLGGCDCIANIQPLCTSCNSSKSLDTTDYRPLYWSECFEEVMSTVPSWVKL